MKIIKYITSEILLRKYINITSEILLNIILLLEIGKKIYFTLKFN